MELGAYRGLSVERPEYTVKEEEIHAEIMRELEKTAPGDRRRDCGEWRYCKY